MSSRDASARGSRYRTSLAPRARADIEEAYAYLAWTDPGVAERWFAGLLLALERLTRFPRRFAFAPEERVLRRGIRQSIVGRYRVLFTVDDEACVVNVLHVRHGARAPFEPDELG